MPAGPSIPDPALVVLVGVSGSGKSSWAARRYRSVEVVSSDHLRSLVGSGPHDLSATTDAFTVLDLLVDARAGRRLTTVVDTLGLEVERRRGYLALARRHGLPAVAVVVDTPGPLCRARNSARDIPVPSAALDGQLRRMRTAVQEVRAEGWDLVLEATDDALPEPEYARASTPPPGQSDESRPGTLEFVLQVSRFPWGKDPAGWLREVVEAAEDCGLSGIALMDHLIQIPQVGRAWEDIPEPFVTLGMVAALSTNLRVGTLVSPVTFRAPGLLAKTVATLDALSGGRAFLGVGAGWWEREHAAFGLPFPSAGERLDLLEQGLQVVRGLWSPGTKAFQAAGVSLPETTCYPRPASAVPIIVGGGGERRTLRIAAAYGDACNVTSDEETLARKIAVLRRHCAELGRDPGEVAVTVLDLPIVGMDREEVASTVERLRGRTPAAQFAARHHAGTPEQHAVRYRRLAALGVSTVFISPPNLTGPAEIRRLAPVVAAFAS